MERIPSFGDLPPHAVSEPFDDVFVPEQPELLRNAFDVVLASGVSREQILEALPYGGEEIEALCGLNLGMLVPANEPASPVVAPRVQMRRDRGGDVLMFERDRRPRQR